MMNGYEYTNAMLAGGYRAALYCRFSKDDALDGESASIANQRDMLEQRCKKQGGERVAVCQDDGCTLWAEMYDTVSIEAKKMIVSCLIKRGEVL